MVDDYSKRQTELFTKVLGQNSFYETNSAEIPEPIETKSRKFRWSSCFSFITKFKKNKTQKIRVSQSYEECVFNEDYTPDKEQSKSITLGNFFLNTLSFFFKLN